MAVHRELALQPRASALGMGAQASRRPGTQRERSLRSQAHACLPTCAHGFSRLPLTLTVPPFLCAHENR